MYGEILNPDEVTPHPNLVAEFKSLASKIEEISDFERQLSETREQAYQTLDEALSLEEQDQIGTISDEIFIELINIAVGELPLPPEMKMEAVLQKIEQNASLQLLGLSRRLVTALRNPKIVEYCLAREAFLARKSEAYDQIQPKWQEITQLLQNQIDYHALIRDLFEETDPAVLLFLVDRNLNLIQFMNTFPPSFDSKADKFEYLQNLYIRNPDFLQLLEDFAPYVMVSAQPRSEDANTVIEDEQILLKLIHFSKQLSAAQSLRDRYQRISEEVIDAYHQASRKLYKLNFVNDRRKREVYPRVKSNPRVLAAFAKIAREFFHDLELANLVQTNSIERQKYEPKVLEKVDIQINGIEEENDERQYAIGPESVQYFFSTERYRDSGSAADLFPGRFLEGITEINFHHATSELTKFYDNYVRRKPEKQETVLSNYRNQITGTLIHEIFERVVVDMTLSELADYDHAVEADSDRLSAVTWYGKYAEVNQDQGFLWQKEDFCEAGRLYVTEPIDLFLLSPARFRFMVSFFSANLPAEYRAQYKREMINRVKKNLFKDRKREKLIREALVVHEKMEKSELREVPGEEAKGVMLGEFISVEKQIAIAEAKGEEIVPNGHIIEIHEPLYLNLSGVEDV